MATHDLRQCALISTSLKIFLTSPVLLAYSPHYLWHAVFKFYKILNQKVNYWVIFWCSIENLKVILVNLLWWQKSSQQHWNMPAEPILVIPFSLCYILSVCLLHCWVSLTNIYGDFPFFQLRERSLRVAFWENTESSLGKGLRLINVLNYMLCP